MLKELILVFESMGIKGDITEDLTLVALGFDSMKIMELVVLLEETFQFQLEDQDLTGANFETVNSVLRLLERYTVTEV